MKYTCNSTCTQNCFLIILLLKSGWGQFFAQRVRFWVFDFAEVGSWVVWFFLGSTYFCFGSCHFSSKNCSFLSKIGVFSLFLIVLDWKKNSVFLEPVCWWPICAATFSGYLVWNFGRPEFFARLWTSVTGFNKSQHWHPVPIHFTCMWTLGWECWWDCSYRWNGCCQL